MVLVGEAYDNNNCEGCLCRVEETSVSCYLQRAEHPHFCAQYCDRFPLEESTNVRLDCDGRTQLSCCDSAPYARKTWAVGDLMSVDHLENVCMTENSYSVEVGALLGFRRNALFEYVVRGLAR